MRSQQFLQDRSRIEVRIVEIASGDRLSGKSDAPLGPLRLKRFLTGPIKPFTTAICLPYEGSSFVVALLSPQADFERLRPADFNDALRCEGPFLKNSREMKAAH